MMTNVSRKKSDSWFLAKNLVAFFMSWVESFHYEKMTHSDSGRFQTSSHVLSVPICLTQKLISETQPKNKRQKKSFQLPDARSGGKPTSFAPL
jgi:hypothetical protein